MTKEKRDYSEYHYLAYSGPPLAEDTPEYAYFRFTKQCWRGYPYPVKIELEGKTFTVIHPTTKEFARASRTFTPEWGNGYNVVHKVKRKE